MRGNSSSELLARKGLDKENEGLRSRQEEVKWEISWRWRHLQAWLGLVGKSSSLQGQVGVEDLIRYDSTVGREVKACPGMVSSPWTLKDCACSPTPPQTLTIREGRGQGADTQMDFKKP